MCRKEIIMKIEQIKEIVEKIRYKDWIFKVGKNEEHYYLQAIFEAPDNHTGIIELQYCRKWQLSLHMTKSEVVRTAYKAVLAAEEHEVGEHFKYRDQLVYCPHMDVDVYVEAMEKNRVDVRDEINYVGSQGAN